MAIVTVHQDVAGREPYQSVKRDPALDYFGFLPRPIRASFDGGRVEPTADFEAAALWIAEHKHRDGFLYPPRQWTTVIEPPSEEPVGMLRASERPALLHRAPPSHQLSLSLPGDHAAHRKDIAAFVIHLCGYLLGTWVQFHDWWFSGRVPIDSQHNIHSTDPVVQDFVERSVRTWSGWDADDQRRMTNILFMHCRASSHEWDWERFMIEYIVFDACWRTAQNVEGLPSVPHAQRINRLCTHFGMHQDATRIGRFVQLRNDLFHESLWDRSQPTSAAREDAFRAAYDLQRLNQRLIPALLGYRNSYVGTDWSSLGTKHFD